MERSVAVRQKLVGLQLVVPPGTEDIADNGCNPTDTSLALSVLCCTTSDGLVRRLDHSSLSRDRVLGRMGPRCSFAAPRSSRFRSQSH